MPDDQQKIKENLCRAREIMCDDDALPDEAPWHEVYRKRQEDYTLLPLPELHPKLRIKVRKLMDAGCTVRDISIGLGIKRGIVEREADRRRKAARRGE